jgi:hypothetical protein
MSDEEDAESYKEIEEAITWLANEGLIYETGKKRWSARIHLV